MGNNPNCRVKASGNYSRRGKDMTAPVVGGCRAGAPAQAGLSELGEAPSSQCLFVYSLPEPRMVFTLSNG